MWYASWKSGARRSRVGSILVLFLFLNMACASTASTPVPPTPADTGPRNVILFIADGGGVAQFTMGRELAKYLNIRDALYLDGHLRGSVMTHSAKERVTDSASSATAYATGVKTYNSAISVDTLRQNLPTVVDAAERQGMATGLVASSRITHATPASFSAHVPERWMESDIADQQIRKGIDVIFGGGLDFYLPESEGGDREDGRNLLDEARELGYEVITEYGAIASLDRMPVLGLFEPDHLPYAIDRERGDADLATLTRKAIELLRANEDGFFLMVEGSRIDHASHQNDAAAAARDVIDFDEAFGVAMEFARRDGQTIVIATSDHETGGLSLGRSAIPDASVAGDPPLTTYWRSLHARGVYDWRPEVLAAVQASTDQIASRLEDESADVRGIMAELAGVDDLTDEEVDALAESRVTRRLVYIIGEIIARRAVIGWTTDGHTAVDVSLYAFGPRSNELEGVIDNAEIGRFIFDVLGMRPELITLE